MAKKGYLDNLELSTVRMTLDEGYKYVKASNPAVLSEINDKKEITPGNEAVLEKTINDFLEINKAE